MKETEKLFSISIPQLIERYHIGEELNGNLIIASGVQSYIEALSFPLRIDALLISICFKGSIKGTVNLKEWELTGCSCLINLPENVVGVHEISSDYQGVTLAISLEYLKEINIDLKTIMPYYVFVRNHPCIQITADEMQILNELYKLIAVSLMNKKSTRKEDIIKGLFSVMIFQLCETLDRINTYDKSFKTKSKEFYFTRFMELLLNDFRCHRNISHYSDKLGITPNYLSALIKETSGSSAAQWIDEYIIMEASILLKFSDKNIQQISEELHFPSQSFFSKYFKQHTGKTPTEYRENMIIHGKI